MSDFQRFPFQTVYSTVNELYGLDINQDTMETAAFVAWNYIGNKECRMYRTQLSTSPDGEGGWVADVPCNCLVIESITADYEDHKHSSPVTDNICSQTAAIEENIENNKEVVSDLYQSGKLIPYRQVGDKLYFTHPYHSLNVLYKGLYADEEGLPQLNFKEVQAIASYCAYTHFYKKALTSSNQLAYQLAQNQYQDWLKKCTQARVPDYLNQNEMDEILDAKTTWNRKSYGYSYKPFSR